MDFLMQHEVPPAIDQIETHPFHQQVDTQAFLEELTDLRGRHAA